MALLSGFGPFEWFEDILILYPGEWATMKLCNGTVPQSTLKSAIRNAFLVMIIMLRMIFSFLHWEEKMHC